MSKTKTKKVSKSDPGPVPKGYRRVRDLKKDDTFFLFVDGDYTLVRVLSIDPDLGHPGQFKLRVVAGSEDSVLVSRPQWQRVQVVE